MPNTPRARLSAFVIAAATIALTACGDSRVRGLSEGISKDSALKILGEGAPEGDSLRNIYKHDRYLVEGAMYDVYLFDPKNRKAWVDKSVPDKELTPVVFVNNKVEGWGWGDMDELAQKHNIQVRRSPTQK
jgi:hypothetical protein